MVPFYKTVFIIALILSACAPSAEEIRSDFQEKLAECVSCEKAEECVIIYPGCPLGCHVAVNIEFSEELNEYAKSLIADYERGGASCNYGCLAPGAVVCTENTCQINMSSDVGK